MPEPDMSNREVDSTGEDLAHARIRSGWDRPRDFALVEVQAQEAFRQLPSEFLFEQEMTRRMGDFTLKTQPIETAMGHGSVQLDAASGFQLDRGSEQSVLAAEIEIDAPSVVYASGQVDLRLVPYYPDGDAVQRVVGFRAYGRLVSQRGGVSIGSLVDGVGTATITHSFLFKFDEPGLHRIALNVALLSASRTDRVQAHNRSLSAFVAAPAK